MSFRGRGGGGGFRGGGGRGGFRGGRGGFDQGPPERVVPLATLVHACQEDLVLKAGMNNASYIRLNQCTISGPPPPFICVPPPPCFSWSG